MGAGPVLFAPNYAALLIFSESSVPRNKNREHLMSELTSVQLGEARRTFLSRMATGMGTLALGSLLKPTLLASADERPIAIPRWSGVMGGRQFGATCKRVIHLCMAGGASHLETLDPKPKLAELGGQPMPKSFTAGQQIAQLIVQTHDTAPQVMPLVAGEDVAEAGVFGRLWNGLKSLFG